MFQPAARTRVNELAVLGMLRMLQCLLTALSSACAPASSDFAVLGIGVAEGVDGEINKDEVLRMTANDGAKNILDPRGHSLNDRCVGPDATALP